MNRFLPLIILFIFIAISATVIAKNMATKNVNQEELSNAKAIMQKIALPEFSLPDLFDDNKNFSLNDLINKEKKYSIVNFFASWCSSCAVEHEVLMRLKSENIADIYGVAWRDFKKNTVEFLQKNGNPFTKTAMDSQGIWTKILDIRAVPETVIIDCEGNVVLRYQGNIDHEDVLEIVKFIKR